ncbi:unnamed protein product [Prorocentrum cordatum]|uniref:Transmembrane protein n=1 Tax=Prorocentrum cordatum TaxID=2364126 RepID=A0ABN9Q0U0_9DINO|nr:unnamed protein product [Polarella glacialis]
MAGLETGLLLDDGTATGGSCQARPAFSARLAISVFFLGALSLNQCGRRPVPSTPRTSRTGPTTRLHHGSPSDGATDVNESDQQVQAVARITEVPRTENRESVTILPQTRLTAAAAGVAALPSHADVNVSNASTRATLLSTRQPMALSLLSLPHWYIFSRRFWGCGARWIGVTLVAFCGGPLVIPLFFCGLALVGFTSRGVMHGSCAACCQAQAGTVAAGSCFACAQSVAARGMIASCSPPVLLSTATVSAMVALVVMYFSHCQYFPDVCCSADW